MKILLDDNTLEQSSVVANASMNRERGITGINSYARDISFNPLEFLVSRLQTQEKVAWLDLCCGTGKALVQAAQHFHRREEMPRVTLLGVDLIPMFAACPPELKNLQLQEATLSSWRPTVSFDLITCVHGLHYIGDKISLIQRAASWLEPEGQFLANLDPVNIYLASEPDTKHLVMKRLRQAGFIFKPRHHVLSCQGRKSIELGLRYLGADDQAGPNFSGQPAVNSYYDIISL